MRRWEHSVPRTKQASLLLIFETITKPKTKFKYA